MAKHKETIELGSSLTSSTASNSGAVGDEELKGGGREPVWRRAVNAVNPLHRGIPPPIPTEPLESPEPHANILSKLTWNWLTPLMRVGYTRPLELNDLYKVPVSRESGMLADKLMANFEKRAAAVRERGADPMDQEERAWVLLRAINDTFFWQFWLGGIAKVTGDTLQICSPLLLKSLINFSTNAYIAKYTNQPGPSTGHGIGLAIGLLVMQVVASFCQHHFFYQSMLVGACSRGALISALYRKTLVLSSKSRLAFTNGKLTNLMSTDTGRIDFAAGYAHIVWAAPVQICICLVILCVNLGASALAGFALLILTMPITAKIFKGLARKRVVVSRITDARVRLTQEILGAMRVIKFYAWSSAFLSKLFDLRDKELAMVRYLQTVRQAVNAVAMSIPIFASILAFVTYSLTGHDLGAGVVFSSLSLLNMLRLPLMFLPMVFSAVTDAWVSLGRLSEVLGAGEVVEGGVRVVGNDEGEEAVWVKGGSFVWEIEDVEKKEEKKEVVKKKGLVARIFGRGKGQEKGKAKEDHGVIQEEDAIEEEAEKNQIDFLHRSVTGSSKKIPGEEDLEVKEVVVTTRDPNTMDNAQAETQYPAATLEADQIDTVPVAAVSAGEPLHKHHLEDIDFKVKRGEFVCIVGAVGSGKSSLLSAIVGDMTTVNGEITIAGTVGYCPQQAWIQNTTVKDNILFGQEFDQARYERVVSDCALVADLEMLPNGDLTEIGERGITVSGGQKQRINLARAAYFNADIVLLDDPLSAVDAHVGRHLLDHCICGIMADKTRILVTHQLHVLPRADRIFCVVDGRITESGTYDELVGKGGAFSKLMAEFGGKEEEKEEEKEAAEEEAIEEATKPAVEKKAAGVPGKGLMQAEERNTGAVKLEVYTTFARSGGGLWVIPAILALVAVTQCANVANNLWLSYWSEDRFGKSNGFYIGIYSGFGAVQALLQFMLGAGLVIIGNKATQVMHANAAKRVMRAPMSFFDTTPLGRIINRFSKDVDTMDNLLTDSYRMFFQTAGGILATFVLIIVYFYWFPIALVPLMSGFWLAALFYRSSAREIKRLDAVTRSHVYSHFGETLTGIPMVRAYGEQARFKRVNEQSIDTMNRAYLITITNQRWLGIRLDMVANLLIFVVAILSVSSGLNVSPAIVGLLLSYIVQVGGMMSWMVRQLAEVENNMNSTERVHHYGIHLDMEKPEYIPERAPRPTWPEKGAIDMKDVVLSYRPGLPAVLKGVDLHINGGERIGVVGRTGAGKSTIFASLYRLIELTAGTITIDGVDIASIGLHDLRSKLSIIPQDPILFQGTIRSNLDPFSERTDQELYDALRRSWLIESSDMSKESEQKLTLDSPVEDEGLNFSLGQRQLLAMARALVRKSRIIILDEATSSVDFETDHKIQQTIASEFGDATLLCIAHRLRTIVGYDRVCVLDAGKVVEYDTPINLFRKEDGVFRGMCLRSGISEGDF
ncbi:hypothetical protein SAICODRAFT_7613 [Saitoella complicata NRRL Y-17804]|uniref:Uncharacterized protein n=1 Tax=Saitoella complicata (strain BCRC 22490 / CBS 7301 / JCM 7358 / NBRC 10748 / NRRL Y-17804) TaxID=698492 RepID=A0A0E9NGQ3_SAICN|nr:uncharacterized protein SAICODRAFT_7613 [Saitoella complicata NRRL Y-17804]ODQ53015.1 hypothetical protein SAICODRAFT_7613 [Saitoella complicata NRRL Y-17804]GAO49019.1 hypothetical protein G7K_3180-t1 [Saitoella complicata NRRL Y-17804]